MREHQGKNMKHTKPLIVISILLVCLPAILRGAEEVPAASLKTADGAPVKKAKAARDENVPDYAMMMAFMKPATVVLKVGELSLTWKEMSPSLRSLLASPNPKENGMREGKMMDPQKLAEELRRRVQRMAKVGLFLQEARARKIEVSEEERTRYLSEMVAKLKQNGKGISKEKYLSSFRQTGESTMARLTLDDTLRMVKMEEQMFGDVDLTEQEYRSYGKYLKAVNEAVDKENQSRKKQVETLLDDPLIKTDEGFAMLAKEYSEGKEGAKGGELDYDFTRQELAEVNELKSFDWQVGEVTPVLETELGFRIMRVLRVSVPAKDGQPEKYRIAQLLFAKLANEDGSREGVKAKVLPLKKQKLLEDFAMELTKKYPVTCVLFPEGLWVEPAEKTTGQGKPVQPASETDKNKAEK